MKKGFCRGLTFHYQTKNIALSKFIIVRKLFFTSLVIACCQTVCAQVDTSLIYLRFPEIPPFKIVNVADSASFTKADLSKKKATIIMVFSPNCEHCQHET